jgi:drug/metabolite transporter (DMT)-like permease
MAAPFPYAGEIASLSVGLIWACSISTYRHFATDIPPQTLNLLRHGVATTGLVMATLILRPELPRDPQCWISLLLSGLVAVVVGDTALLAALQRLGAQLTSATQCLVPPTVAILGYLLLDESLPLLRSFGIALTGLSILVIIRASHPGRVTSGSHHRLGLLLALVSCAAQSAAILLARNALPKAGVLPGTLLRVVPATAVLALISLVQARRGTNLGWNRVGERFGVLCLAATFGSLGGLSLLSAGLKYAPAGVAAALSSTYPIWVVPIAVLILKENVRKTAMAATFTATIGVMLVTLAAHKGREMGSTPVPTTIPPATSWHEPSSSTSTTSPR